VARGDIFFSDSDRLAFLSRLAEAQERWGVVVHGYCLMTNHYHLEIESPEGPLSKPVQWLNQTHASYVNRTAGRDGHLFQGRFKSVVVEADAHLHELTRYVHLNPVRARMVKHPADYRWSSYRDYLGLRRVPPWLSTVETLKRFGKTRHQQRERYRQFVEEPPEVVQNPLREMALGAVLGTGEFVEWVSETFLDSDPSPNLAHVRKAFARTPLETVVEVVAEAEQVPPESLRLRGKRGNRPRDLALYLARQHSGRELTELGQYFGQVGPTAAGMACKRIESDLARSRAQRAKVKALSQRILEATTRQ